MGSDIEEEAGFDEEGGEAFLPELFICLGDAWKLEVCETASLGAVVGEGEGVGAIAEFWWEIEEAEVGSCQTVSTNSRLIPVTGGGRGLTSCGGLRCSSR